MNSPNKSATISVADFLFYHFFKRLLSRTRVNRKDAEGNAIYDYDYAVSCMKQHSIIEFINCRYSDGSAFNKNVFLKGTTDSSGDPDKVIINGTTYTDINEFTYW